MLRTEPITELTAFIAMLIAFCIPFQILIARLDIADHAECHLSEIALKMPVIIDRTKFIEPDMRELIVFQMPSAIC